jgi:small-conductance mechanosensitive channel
VSAVPDGDQSTAPDDAAAQRGGAPDDPTGQHDISFYRQSAISRLVTVEAARRARKARREAVLLLPVVGGLILIWVYREDLFGTDVPVRIATALLLAAVGWRFARDLGRAIGPRLMRRFDPGTASTVSFLIQLLTLLVIVVVALRIVDLNPRAIALGGAVTAVVIGLAAQSTLGNVIAGIVLQASRPFRVGERVRLQGGPLGATVEGTVASQGLIYTTLARGNGAILVPNNSALGATIVPLRAPAGVDMRARIRAGVKPSELQRTLAAEVRVPTRDEPDISLEEVHADAATVRIRATPVNDADGARLADEMLAVVTKVAAEAPTATMS